MLTTQKLTLNHKLGPEQEIIYQTLLDFKKFGQIHSYIQDVKVIQSNSPNYIEYRIFEEVYLFGFIKNKPIYDVKVYEIERNKHIRYVSQVKKNISLTIDFKLSKGINSNIDIEEQFTVKANPVIAPIFLHILKKAHLRFFENLRRILLNSIEDVQIKDSPFA